jgi:hypothetical protein
MKDMLNLFKRDAEFDHRHVDDADDNTIFTRTRVLEERGQGGSYSTDVGEERSKPRKAGSLGLKRVEDSVWGRR